MMRPHVNLLWILLTILVVASLHAQDEAEVWKLSSSDMSSEEWAWNPATGEMVGIDATVQFSNTVLTAKRISVNYKTGEVVAEGRVRIEHEEQIWVGEKIRYNFITRKMRTEEFRTGAPPLFASGRGVESDTTNDTHEATGARITTDDHENPFVVVRAKSIRIKPDDSITAKHATLWVGKVPVFYWPYYSRKIGKRQNHFLLLPGYRSAYGAYIYTGYSWYLNDHLDATLHLDYRTERGPGIGTAVNYDYGQWGAGELKYYFAYDRKPGADAFGEPIDKNRQAFLFNYQANPSTNLFIKGKISYESDPLFRQEFFETAYEEDPQPITFGQVRRHWDNMTLDFYVQPRVNDFYETVERLPDVKFSVLPAPLWTLPIVYESESSFGRYQRLFPDTSNTNSLSQLDYEGARADTFHQFSAPFNLFGWLNVIPKAGGRASYYSSSDYNPMNVPGATTDATWRGVFNTGVEVSTKASQLWPEISNKTFDVDGLRHIIQPAFNYVYVPNPTQDPMQLPQYDYESASFYPLPIDYPEYNSIDAIQAQNVVRLGLRNKLQTKREGELENLVGWDMFIDWHVNPEDEQAQFSNFYSDLTLRPRSWLVLQGQVQLDVDTGQWQQALTRLTISPGTRWSWGLTHWYLREGFPSTVLGAPLGDNTLQSTFYLRFTENWGFRMSHRFDAKNSRLEEQYYTVYRDLRSFTTALTFRIRDPLEDSTDYSVALTLSLKAMPRMDVGEDSVRPSQLLGY